jgi:glycosyltransferase involved in cell wall biosynthesis
MSHATRPILLVGPLPPPLNGMTVMTALARLGMAREGVPVVHFDISDHRPVGNVGRLDPRNIFLAIGHALGMHATLAKTRPRLVYLPIAQSTLGFLRDALLILAARWHRVPVAVHLHGASFRTFYEEARGPVRAIVRASLKGAAAAIVLGESSRGIFEGLVPPERVHVLPNGIPAPPRFLPSVNPTDRFDVLYMSNFFPGKGHRDLVEAIPAVAAVYPSLQVKLAGEWVSDEEREEVLAEIARRGLDERVRFLSSVTGLRKAELFRGARIFVFPPTGVEGQPVVILEAMSYGLPVITTPLGGIRDTVVENETALYVPPGRPAALSAAILRLLEDEPLRARLGEAGKRRYHRHHRFVGFQRGLKTTLEGATLEERLALAAEAP